MTVLARLAIAGATLWLFPLPTALLVLCVAAFVGGVWQAAWRR